MKYLFAMIAVLLATAHSAKAQKSVIIANRSVGAVVMSAADVRTLFTGGELHLAGGAHCVPVLLRDGAVQDEFLKDYIGKGDVGFRSGWRSLVFSGQATMPHTVDDEAAVVSYVARTPGAVGYISKGTVHDGVVVITVR